MFPGLLNVIESLPFITYPLQRYDFKFDTLYGRMLIQYIIQISLIYDSYEYAYYGDIHRNKHLYTDMCICMTKNQAHT